MRPFTWRAAALECAEALVAFAVLIVGLFLLL